MNFVESPENSKLYITLSAAAAVGVVTVVSIFLKHRKCKAKDGPINPIIKKDQKKVTDVVDIEDLLSKIKPGGKISFCRCWRSKNVSPKIDMFTLY